MKSRHSMAAFLCQRMKIAVKMLLVSKIHLLKNGNRAKELNSRGKG